MSNTSRSILFVGAEPIQAGAPKTGRHNPVWQRLASAFVSVETVADVYLALARWGRGIVRPVAVIVWVDFLQPDEFEFFQLAARHHGQTPVYVCGSPQAAGKIEQAVRSGARGVLTADDVDELLYDLGGMEPDREIDEPALDAGAEDSTSVVRVPWKDYQGGPLRSPPKKPGDASTHRKAKDDKPGPRKFPDDVLEGPLLTPEELEALMREDFRTRPAFDQADNQADEGQKR